MRLRLFLPLIAFAATLAVAETVRVPGHAAANAKSAPVATLRADAAAPVAATTLPWRPPVGTKDEAAPDGFVEKALRIGDRRDVPAAPIGLPWRPAPGGGWAARVSLRSPGAVALRLAVRATRWPDGAELR